MKGLNDALYNENLIKEDGTDAVLQENKNKKRFNIFDMNVIKKWLTDDKEFSDFD
jgi:hypothetical protein